MNDKIIAQAFDKTYVNVIFIFQELSLFKKERYFISPTRLKRNLI